MSEISYPIKISDIINEDGTTLEDFPKNPLMDKWIEKYPPTRYGEPCGPYLKLKDSSKLMNYGCVLCAENCPYSDHWKIPEEDIEEYEEYRQKVAEYHKLHNPDMISNINIYLKGLFNNDSIES